MLNYIYLTYITYKVVTDLKYYVDRFGCVYYIVQYTTNCVSNSLKSLYNKSFEISESSENCTYPEEPNE